MSFNVGDLIGLDEERAKKLASSAGYLIIHELVNCSYKAHRIQIQVDSKGVVTSAKVG